MWQKPLGNAYGMDLGDWGCDVAQIHGRTTWRAPHRYSYRKARVCNPVQRLSELIFTTRRPTPTNTDRTESGSFRGDVASREWKWGITKVMMALQPVEAVALVWNTVVIVFMTACCVNHSVWPECRSLALGLASNTSCRCVVRLPCTRLVSL